MRTELSVVSQTQLYENADMIQKSFRMLVRILIFFCLLLLFYLASFLGVDLDLDFVLQKLNSMLLAKGIRFLFSRLGWFGLLVEGLLVLGDNSGGWCNMMAPSGGSGATWKEDTREIDILLESSWETEDTGSSVNQPVAPPANQVAFPGEEAGPSNPVRPFPYHDDDLIGGDSVRAIEQRFVERLRAKKPSPSLEDYRLARIQAEDQFEVKVEIIKLMAGLDPKGDWMGRGARALENPRTATALEKLYKILDELKQGGVDSPVFSHLQSKVFRIWHDDDQNSAS